MRKNLFSSPFISFISYSCAKYSPELEVFCIFQLFSIEQLMWAGNRTELDYCGSYWTSKPNHNWTCCGIPNPPVTIVEMPWVRKVKTWMGCLPLQFLPPPPLSLPVLSSYNKYQLQWKSILRKELWLRARQLQTTFYSYSQVFIFTFSWNKK